MPAERLRRLRRLRSPVEAVLVLRILAFATAVPLLLRLRLPTLESLLEPRRRARQRDPQTVMRLCTCIDAVLRAGWPLARRGCLTRGLTRYYFLRRAGADVRLAFGLGTVEGNLEGHCWLVRDGEPFLEPVDPRAAFVETYSIPSVPPLARSIHRRPEPTRGMPRIGARYSLHGTRLAITSDDPAVMRDIARRLRHFRVAEEGDADAVFELRASRLPHDHAVERPPGPMRPIYDPPKGEVSYSDARDLLYIACGDAIRIVCDAATGTASCSFGPRADDASLVAHPFLTLALLELLKRRGRFGLHAAALSRDGRGLLLPGASGSGKSTLALALARSGFDFLGDDLCFLAPEPAGVRALAFPDEVDVTAETTQLVPGLPRWSDLPVAPGREKRPLLIEDVRDTRVARECTPAVLVFPRIAHEARSVIAPLDPDAALLELAPNVLLTEARASQSHLDALAALVRQCRCYTLGTGHDFAEAAALLRELLDEQRNPIGASPGSRAAPAASRIDPAAHSPGASM